MILPTKYKMKPPPSAKPIKSILKNLGCVGLWVMNENGGLSAYDSSGNCIKGTLQGDAQFGAGEFGSAVLLDGNGDFIELATLEQKIENDNTGSIIFWTMFGRRGTANFEILYMHSAMAEPDRFMWFGANDDDKLAFSWRADTGVWGANYLNIWGDTVLANNVSYQCVVTTDGSTYKLYVNGKEEVLGVLGINNGKWFSDLPVDNYSDFFGKWDRSSGPLYYLLGQIDCAIFCNRVLTASIISQLYHKPFFMFGRKRTIVTVPAIL